MGEKDGSGRTVVSMQGRAFKSRLRIFLGISGADSVKVTYIFAKSTTIRVTLLDIEPALILRTRPKSLNCLGREIDRLAVDRGLSSRVEARCNRNFCASSAGEVYCGVKFRNRVSRIRKKWGSDR